MGSLPSNYVIRQPSLVTDFSSLTGMNLTQGTGSVTLDTDPTKVRTGSASLKIVQQASASSASCDLDLRNVVFGGSGSEGPSALADNLWHLRCFVDIPGNQNNLSFFVSNDVTSFANYFAAGFMGTQLSNINNQWWDRPENRKDWVVGAGSPSWSNPVRYIRIRPNANANGPLTTWLDAVYRGGYARPKVVISFDDSSDGQYTLAKPVLDTYGFKGTFYVVGQSVSTNATGAITQAQADTLYGEGHDISYHSWSNADHTNYSTLRADGLYASSRNFQAWAEARGYERSRLHHAMPTGAYNPTIDAVIRGEGYLTGRGTVRLQQSHLLGLDNAWHLRAYTWASADGVAGVVDWINNAITYGTTLNLVFHGVHVTTSVAQQISVADFDAIMRHLYKCQQGNLLDVVPASEWYAGLSRGRAAK